MILDGGARVVPVHLEDADLLRYRSRCLAVTVCRLDRAATRSCTTCHRSAAALTITVIANHHSTALITSVTTGVYPIRSRRNQAANRCTSAITGTANIITDSQYIWS